MIDINSILTEILRLLPFFIPIIIIQYGLMIFALVQLFRNEAAYLPKWGWALIIIFINIIGSIVFLLVGRKKYKEND
ncbi:MAG: PLDc N-terminal domain-containing protein [Actinobacteria bacterium]|nr:PLDc N-terminal domain-containing protein [Actinomycetota bacterium]